MVNQVNRLVNLFISKIKSLILPTLLRKRNIILGKKIVSVFSKFFDLILFNSFSTNFVEVLKNQYALKLPLFRYNLLFSS